MSIAVLFVYGSLKRGGRHHDLMRHARFLGEAETEPGFGLESLGEYLALVERPVAQPVAQPVEQPVEQEGASSRVPGELFELDAESLAALDEFEGDGYVRKAVPVRCSGEHAREISGEVRFALAYVMKPG